MLRAYHANVAALSPEQAGHVAERLIRRLRLAERPDCTSGEELANFCEEAGIDSADVVMALAEDPTQIGFDCLERVVGSSVKRIPRGVSGFPVEADRPAVRTAQAQQPPRERPRGGGVRRSDPRVVLSVAPNPKKPGSKCHTRYLLWQVGATVDAMLAAGVTAADLKYDVDHGFVTLGAAK